MNHNVWCHLHGADGDVCDCTVGREVRGRGSMSDRRIVVVAEMLDSLPPGMDPERVAVAILAALDADARTRPFIGIVPPERDFSDYRDRCGEVEEPEVTLEQAVAGVQATRHEGIGEFHKDTSHNPEA